MIPASEPASERAALRVRRRIAQDPMGVLGFVLVLLVVVAAVFADWLAPYDPLKLDVLDRLAGPSWFHLLGTDQLGRDILSRVIKGSQIALEVGLTATTVSLCGGLGLGLIAGYGPRWLDKVLLLLFDAVQAFPLIMLALAVITLSGPSLFTVLLIVIIVTVPRYARLVRTSTLAVKHTEFVLAERALGARGPRILLHHILPNVVGPLLILASMDIPVVITLEAGLSFLGLGVPPPAPSWGRLLNEGYNFIRDTPWIVIGGGVPLIITTLGFTFLGETLRDLLDPKLRQVL
jgi:peptide/nickel transport system permease protein